ncbi:MAG TPA: glycosyl hydrolase family 28-related protein, partial [Actinomycetota bacterium]
MATSATTVTYTLFGKELAGATETFKTLAQGQLPSSAGVLYTVPASTAAVVEEITLANTAGTVQTVTLYVNGAAAANEIGSFVIPAGGSVTYNGEWTVYDAQGYPQISPLSEIQKGNLYVTGPRPWVDAVAYGADPTGASDSRAAINAALTAASAGRGVVYLPAGNYFVSGTLAVPAFVHLMGAGQYITVIAPTFSTGHVFTLGGGSSIEGLWIFGPSANTNAGGTLSGTPQTVAVTTTQSFPASGTGSIALTNGTWTTFTWTGTTPTSFTGVTGSGAFSAGTAIMLRSGGSAIDTGADSLWRV